MSSIALEPTQFDLFGDPTQVDLWYLSCYSSLHCCLFHARRNLIAHHTRHAPAKGARGRGVEQGCVWPLGDSSHKTNRRCTAAPWARPRLQKACPGGPTPCLKPLLHTHTLPLPAQSITSHSRPFDECTRIRCLMRCLIITVLVQMSIAECLCTTHERDTKAQESTPHHTHTRAQGTRREHTTTRQSAIAFLGCSEKVFPLRSAPSYFFLVLYFLFFLSIYLFSISFAPTFLVGTLPIYI